MEFIKHFLNEDLEQLNLEINSMHNDSLTVIQLSLDGQIDAAEQSALNILKSLKVVRALNVKKLKRDEHERNEMAVRRNYF